VVRLFRRERARFDDAPVHERVHVEGPGPGTLAGALEHHSYRTFEECVAKCVRYAHAGAERAALAGRRAGPLDVLVRPPLRFFRQYVLQLGFLDGAHGLALCGFAAAQVFLKYAELWERTRAAGPP
jgi:(heptosyl)LPS beta-1,4-glucosyltransferase